MRKIIVTDLDGTLISINSFPLWIRFLIKKAICNINLTLLFNLLILLFKRKVLKETHAKFKRQLMQLKYPQSYDHNFAVQLLCYINEDVVTELFNFQNACIVISTAAPKNYAEALVSVLPFKVDKLHCSKITNGKIYENFAHNKVISFKNDFNNQVIDLFLTDHIEDLPMILHSEEIILVNPKQETIDQVTLNNLRNIRGLS